MTNKIQFTCTTTPKPQPRPKAARRGPRVHIYTPNGNGIKEYKRMLAASAIRAMPTPSPLEGPLSVILRFSLPRPQAHLSKAKSAYGQVKERFLGEFHETKPDIDNLIKAVLDALNGVAYKDDSQVVRIEAMKEYANTDPFVSVLIEEFPKPLEEDQ